MSYYDVVILGGGITGVLAGIFLKESGMSVALVEYNSKILNNLEDRVFAFSKRSKEILESKNIWEHIERHSPIYDIMIYDEESSSYVHFDSSIIGSSPMGYIVQAKELVKSLERMTDFHVLTSSSYNSFEVKEGFTEVSFSCGRKINTKLVICAEGKNSVFRRLASFNTVRHNYKQSCITCNITHEKHHNNMAIENFFPAGPLAILPMAGGYESSIVWTEDTKTADIIYNLKTSDFLDCLRGKLAKQHIGEIQDVSSRINCYKIELVLAENIYGNRSILVGDSSHSIHPVAGQGLNIGIRDIELLASVLKKYNSLGSDIGQDFILKEIDNKRIFDNFSMSAITTGINRIFSSKSNISKVLRRTAMSIVEMSPSLKEVFIRHAMGHSSIISESLK